MNVEIPNCEIAMALLNGLLEEYNVLISALYAINEYERNLNFEIVKSHIIQEEQCIKMRTKSALEKAETAASLSKGLGEIGRPSRGRTYCNHHKRPAHIESKCWVKLPHLNSQSNKDSGNKPALVVN